MDSFVIRVFREKNSTGFIKGFSEDPESFTSAMNRTEKIMRVLYLKKLYLWPRFRLEIAKNLELSLQPTVLEISLNLTPSMKIIQNSILIAMDISLSDLKKSCPYLDFSANSNTMEKEHFNLENGLFQSFDNYLKMVLESEWHKLSLKTKQLMNDITTLRKLLDYLIRYDAFSFYYLLTKLQATSSEQSSPSLW
jgi:DNA excision repair protein ERCC-4